MTLAITRVVSPSLNSCELSYIPEQPIDVCLAQRQHEEYCRALVDSGATVIQAPTLLESPDATFVEDTAVALDEIAVLTTMGSESRRAEVSSMEDVLRKYRRVEKLALPGLLEGGDIMRIGKRIFAGLSTRTNDEGITQLEHLVRQFGYTVERIPVSRCLHLKTGVTALDDDTLLINRNLISWNDTRFSFIDVDTREPWAANVLKIGSTVLMPAEYPRTAAHLRDAGFDVRTISMSEILKAEAGVTCLSILLKRATEVPVRS